MTVKDREYRLRSLGSFSTMETNTEAGESIASIILPSYCERPGSPTWCNVEEDQQHFGGQSPNGRCWDKRSTTLERRDKDYFAAARRNARSILAMSRVPTTRFSFPDHLEDWVRRTNTDLLRVFYGGDISLSGSNSYLYGVTYVARKYPDKLFFTRTSSLKVAKTLVALEEEKKLVLPDNVLLFIEDVGQVKDIKRELGDMGSDLPILKYAEEGEDDLKFFPEDIADVTVAYDKLKTCKKKR